MRRWDTFDILMGSAVTLMLVFLALVFVWAGVAAYVDQQCLEKGYPASRVTWNFEGYCLNVEGDITGTVDKL